MTISFTGQRRRPWGNSYERAPRPWLTLDAAVRCPAFGRLKLHSLNEAETAVKRWRQTGGDVATAVAELPTDPSYHQQYAEIIAEADQTGLWGLQPGTHTHDNAEAFVTRMAEILEAAS